MSGSVCDRCGERVWSETVSDTAAGIFTLGMSVPWTMMQDYMCPTCQRELRRKGRDPEDWHVHGEKIMESDLWKK